MDWTPVIILSPSQIVCGSALEIVIPFNSLLHNNNKLFVDWIQFFMRVKERKIFPWKHN